MIRVGYKTSNTTHKKTYIKHTFANVFALLHARRGLFRRTRMSGRTRSHHKGACRVLPIIGSLFERNCGPQYAACAYVSTMSQIISYKSPCVNSGPCELFIARLCSTCHAFSWLSHRVHGARLLVTRFIAAVQGFSKLTMIRNSCELTQSANLSQSLSANPVLLS